MLTTHPSIMLGSYVWDQDWLPSDEFRLRMDGLERVMDRRGWNGILVYGDAREHAALAWCSNFIPRMRWGMALLPRPGSGADRGGPRLLASMSSRDIPAMRTMTWIPDVATGWEWKHFDSWVGGLQPGVLGTAGFELITPLLHGQVERSLAGKCTMADADADLAELRQSQRPREIALIRRSADVSAAAAKALLTAWRSGMPAEAALLEAERTARGMAAQDVRTLISFDGGRTLRPFNGTFDERPDATVAYIAVKLLGYWSELFVDAARQPPKIAEIAERALSGLVDAIRPGMTGGKLYDTGLGLLGGRDLHPMLSGSVGQRIGLSLADGGPFAKDAPTLVAAGNVYSLRVGAIDAQEGGAIASAMVALSADGRKTVLARAPA